MDSYRPEQIETSDNGHRSSESQVETVDHPEPTNVYADVVRAAEPPEIIQFEVNTDPYANVLPGPPRIARWRPEYEGEPPKRQWTLRAVAIGLLIVFLVPGLMIVFAQLNP